MFTPVKLKDGGTALINLNNVIDIRENSEGGTNILFGLDARGIGLYWVQVEENLDTMAQKLTRIGLIK